MSGRKELLEMHEWHMRRTVARFLALKSCARCKDPASRRAMGTNERRKACARYDNPPAYSLPGDIHAFDAGSTAELAPDA
jgi:hypothetical protein